MECEDCSGIGYYKKVDVDLIIPNKNLSIKEGGIATLNGANDKSYYYQIVRTIADIYKFDLETPLKDAPKEFMDDILYGTDRTIEFEFDSRYQGYRRYKGTFEGIVKNLERRYKETNSDGMRERIDDYMSEIPCPSCHGDRLRPEILAVRVGSLNIAEVTNLSIDKSYEYFDSLELSEKKNNIRANFKRDKRKTSILERCRFKLLDYVKECRNFIGR